MSGDDDNVTDFRPPANSGRKQGRWQPGQSGNPAGKPTGTRHRATLAAEALLAGEAVALTRKAVEMALAGDGQALRLCIDRIMPPRRGRTVQIELPALTTAASLAEAQARVIGAVAAGQIDTDEAVGLSRLLEATGTALERADLESRIAALEARKEQRK